MKIAVVGAGAWGLPTATQLARRGHEVTLVEAYEVGHAHGSSSGDTRLWRLSHADALMVRLAQRAVDAWEQLEADSGTSILMPRGLLWRGASAPDVAAALRAEDVPYTEVASADVGKFFHGLRPSGSDAVWQTTAGPLWAAESLQAHYRLFEAANGRLLAHTRLIDIEKRHAGPRLTVQRTGMSAARLDVDSVVLALGPWTSEFLPKLGVELGLHPVLEQVSYFGPSSAAVDAESVGLEWLPGFYDGPTDDEPGLYSMPVPGVGYKIGLDDAVADFVSGENDRSPRPPRTRAIEGRVERDFAALAPKALKSMVCTWTDSPDGRFVIDTLWDGQVVLACGDSGTGFKFSALMGHLLGDLAEGKTPDADVATFGLARLADYDPSTRPEKFLQ
jgi:sarcosine oxidase